MPDAMPTPQESEAAFETAWQQNWQPQVESNWITRSHEDDIKRAAKQVWDAAVAWRQQKDAEA